jgi:hypothetical protein
MSCLQACREAYTVNESWADEPLQDGLSHRVGDRQAAVMYLQAAALTDDPETRKLLRRRGVDLLLRRPEGPRMRRAS